MTTTIQSIGMHCDVALFDFRLTHSVKQNAHVTNLVQDEHGNQCRPVLKLVKNLGPPSCQTYIDQIHGHVDIWIREERRIAFSIRVRFTEKPFSVVINVPVYFDRQGPSSVLRESITWSPHFLDVRVLIDAC